jgi:hypothetical protein
MAGHTILLNLIGGVALLLWGTHMVQAAILKGFGPQLRAAIARAAAGPLRAAATGTATAMALQSATATAMLVTAFAGRRLIALPAAAAAAADQGQPEGQPGRPPDPGVRPCRVGPHGGPAHFISRRHFRRPSHRFSALEAAPRARPDPAWTSASRNVQPRGRGAKKG